jgi:hypothetical protein
LCGCFVSGADQLLSEWTPNNAIKDYVRTFQTNGYFNSTYSVPISYDDFFGSGHSIVGYDLTTARNSGINPNSNATTIPGIVIISYYSYSQLLQSIT